MNTKHTPGPWKCVPDAWIVADNGAVILTSQGMEEADARLIAAAPDLLAALQAMFDRIGDGGYFPSCGKTISDQARAAIAKATGAA
jgi:hypothetical protein